MDILLKYFPDLTEIQKEQFEKLLPLYSEWNQKINVISRNDVKELYTRHVLHSLAIGKFITFTKGSEIMDIGTGGGFPGIPLAILFPKASFLLVDSIEKKILVVKGVINELGLENAVTQRGRAEDIHRKVDFVVCRAVAKTSKLLEWTEKSYRAVQNNSIPNGLLALKGGDLKEELSEISHKLKTHNLSLYFEEEFFETKKLVYVSVKK